MVTILPRNSGKNPMQMRTHVYCIREGFHTAFVQTIADVLSISESVRAKHVCYALRVQPRSHVTASVIPDLNLLLDRQLLGPLLGRGLLTFPLSRSQDVLELGGELREAGVKQCKLEQSQKFRV